MPKQKFGLIETRCPHCDCRAALLAPDALDVVSDETLSIVRGIVGAGRTDDRALPVVLPESDRESYVCPACGKDFKPASRRVSRIRFPDV
jgi:DNA-directed RNA polymerase subunit RPC12/RpoP